LVTILDDIQAKAKAEKLKKAVFPTAGMSTIQSADNMMETVPEEAIDSMGMSVVDNGELAPRFDLRLALLGRTFSGKKTISKKMQDHLGG